MRILVTGSAGHLGDALVRTLHEAGHDIVAVDRKPSALTTHVGTISERAFVERCFDEVEAVVHTATLHKPHVATHDRREFVDTNVVGTLNLLEAAAARRVGAFVFTSTTSTFGDALVPPPGAPANWIDEEVAPVPKNIYGVTKVAAEDLCQLFHRNQKLACVILRTSRFFPEPDDDKAMRDAYADGNAKQNELLHRRVDLEDVVTAHLNALERAATIGFGRYIVSATTPFTREDLAELRTDAPAVVRRRFPEYEAEYQRRGWRMFPRIDRVYDNARARSELGWKPRYDFGSCLEKLRAGLDPQSPLARAIGSRGYHADAFEDEPDPVR